MQAGNKQMTNRGASEGLGEIDFLLGQDRHVRQARATACAQNSWGFKGCRQPVSLCLSFIHGPKRHTEGGTPHRMQALKCLTGCPAH